MHQLVDRLWKPGTVLADPERDFQVTIQGVLKEPYHDSQKETIAVLHGTYGKMARTTGILLEERECVVKIYVTPYVVFGLIRLLHEGCLLI
jgi:hypothetical protein